MATRNNNVQLLTTLVDWDDIEDSEYRFLVDGKDVKYITTAPGIFPKDDRTFAPILIPLLPKFPTGDWNEGYISKDRHTGELLFSQIKTSNLPGVKNDWHPVKIDHLELTKLDRLRQNIYKVCHPLFPSPVVVKFTEFSWQTPYIESETTAYEMIDGTGVAPKFLGHVTEAGRIIGFLIDFVGDARIAISGDLAACQEVLSKLHILGLKHGDINKHNFLAGKRGVVLVDFETTRRCDVIEELEEEYGKLEESLKSSSRRGGIGERTTGLQP